MDKLCFNCQRTKNLELFYKNKARYDGVDARCIECSKIDKKERFLIRKNSNKTKEEIEIERRIKIGKAMKGRIFSKETIAKIVKANTGRKRSEETRLKLIEAHKKYAERIGLFIHCRVCKNIFKRRNKNTILCSRRCRGLYQDTRKSKSCKFCDKKMLVSSCLFNRKSFCSRICMGKHYSIYRVKENSPSWRGGIKKENDRRKSFEGQKWRKLIFERDDYTCQICGIKSGYLQADHIKPWGQYPELRYELSNGRTLCINCHKKTDTYGYRGHKQL